MKFRVRNPLVRARILRRGMWNIADVPMVVSKWSPDTENETPESKSIPMWVHLKNVPMNMFSWEGLSFIASAVGHPVRLHPETAACASFETAKIFVNADLSRELPRNICFSKHGKEAMVEFSYPWLPPRCSLCDKWGHLSSVCVVNKKDVIIPPRILQRSGVGDDSSVPAGKNRVQTEILIATEQVAAEKMRDPVPSTELVESVENAEAQWSAVPLSKAGRNPIKNVTVIHMAASTSKFAPLSETEEEGEILENSEGENEVVADDDNSSTNTQRVEGHQKSEEVVESIKRHKPRTSKKKEKVTSMTSNVAIKDALPIAPNKKSSRKNN